MRLACSNRLRAPALGFAAGMVISVAAVGCAISPAQEVQIGSQYSAEINRQLPIVEDSRAQGYINALGREIARNATRKFGYRFFIVNTDAVNAFALPGGYVYVNRGLVERTDNLAELAGVLAHEIAHVEERHGAEQLERVQRANLGLNVAYVLLGRAPGGGERTAIDLGGGAFFARHGREAEQEADRVAVRLLLASRIDPNGLVTFFRELMAERSRRPTAVEQWFSTHPTTEDRIAGTSAEIARIPRTRLRNMQVNSQAYQAFKSRLRQYPAPPPNRTAGR